MLKYACFFSILINRLRSLQVRRVQHQLGFAVSGGKVVVCKTEVLEQARVHRHRQDDVNDAENNGTIDRAAGNAETVDSANNGKTLEEMT